MKIAKWELDSTNRCQTYRLDGLPELVHLIKTGYDNLFIVVFEDGYGMIDNNVLYYTKQQIKEKFDIEIS